METPYKFSANIYRVAAQRNKKAEYTKSLTITIVYEKAGIGIQSETRSSEKMLFGEIGPKKS